VAFFVEVLTDNSFITAGLSNGDGMLTKFAADGTVEWSKGFGGGNFEVFYHVIQCSDGNFLAVGETSSVGGADFSFYVVKVDPSGNVLWERICGGTAYDSARGVCEVSDGYVVTGNTQSFGVGIMDIYVEKLDFNGNSLWSKAWGTSANDSAGEPRPSSGNEIWVNGRMNIVAGNADGVLMRISTDGTLLGTTRADGSGDDWINYLSDGGAGLTGSGATWSYSGGSQLQPIILGYNPSGSLVWAKRYLIPSGNYDINAEDCPDGGFIFSPIKQIGGADPNAYLVKTDGSGNISWAKSYSFGGTGKMYHARPAPDGGYVAVGYCFGAGQDLFIIKTDAAGNVAGCCPEDAPITAAAVTPNTANASPGGANGIPAADASQQIQDFSLVETSLCNGSGCCDTYAGTMLEQTLHACINEPATLTHNGNEVLDGNDLLQFILFSDPNDTLGSIIATSNTPTFAFNPATMQTEVTYYVAAIAGNNVGGNVDLNDPCLDISDNAALLIWHPLPEAELQTDTSDVCPGDCHTLTAVLTGTPPFTLTVSSPAGTTTVTIQDNSGTFQICLPPGTPPGSFTVQATALVDAYCTCP